MPESGPDNQRLTLAPGFAIKLLEEPCVYDLAGDELFALNRQALEFILKCAGPNPPTRAEGDPEFVETALREGVLVPAPAAHNRTPAPEIRPAPHPSLRYLELHVTRRCNLRCRHCYIEEPQGELSLDEIQRVAAEFAAMGGLRLLVTGGEPALHPDFDRINELVAGLPVHSVLITNGTALDREAILGLHFHSVQVSLDGMEPGNDHIRGRGAFARAVEAIDALLEGGKPVAVATMLHSRNLGELEALERWLIERGVGEWNVDAPALAGRLAAEPDLYPGHKAAAGALHRFGFGAGKHEAWGEWACGAHLAAVLPHGAVVPCPFFPDRAGGNIKDTSLESAWLAAPKFLLADVDCDCGFFEDCRGGCRFRARVHGSERGPDPVRCFINKGIGPDRVSHFPRGEV